MGDRLFSHLHNCISIPLPPAFNGKQTIRDNSISESLPLPLPQLIYEIIYYDSIQNRSANEYIRITSYSLTQILSERPVTNRTLHLSHSFSKILPTMRLWKHSRLYNRSKYRMEVRPVYRPTPSLPLSKQINHIIGKTFLFPRFRFEIQIRDLWQIESRKEYKDNIQF